MEQCNSQRTKEELTRELKALKKLLHKLVIKTPTHATKEIELLKKIIEELEGGTI